MPPRTDSCLSTVPVEPFGTGEISVGLIVADYPSKTDKAESSNSRTEKMADKEWKVTMEKEHICEPGPLGLAAFAFTLFVLSVHNAGWAPDVMWVGPALFYGGLVLLLAGMWEFKKNNIFGATAFSTLGGFWMGIGFFGVLILAGWVPATVDVSDAFGWFLTALFIFHSYMTITSALLPKAIFVVFFITEITLILLMIGSFQHNATWTKCGGYFGVAAAASAWYASFALVFNLTAKKMVFPLGSPILVLALPASGAGEP